jgi:hypothetical protein
MNRKYAGFIFLGICILLAILLLTRLISPLVSGCLFAVALVVLGLLSGGFRKS